MSDLISRRKAIEQIQAWAVNLNSPNMLSREDTVYILESLPEAVVRCKDCKHYRPDAKPDYEKCHHHLIYMDPEEWCSYGERRTE